MVISSTDNLRALLENIKSLGFFDRLFDWRQIGELNAAASNEFRTIINELEAINAQNELTEIRIRQLYSELEDQKNQYSLLKTEHASLKNSTGNIYDVLVNRENELGALKESELRNARRLIELEKECERLRVVIDQYIQLFQEKEKELGTLREADSKNTLRIKELHKESDKLQAALDQFTQKLQAKECDPDTLKQADSKNARKIARSNVMIGNPANSSEKRILLVEDDSNFSNMLEHLLVEIGYTVVGIAVSGEEALAMAGSESRLDVILIDIHIEGEMDGIETARHLKGLYGTPTIFMTAQADDETIRRVVLTESEGYLVKPINRQELFANLEIAIHKKRKNDAFTVRRAAVNP